MGKNKLLDTADKTLKRVNIIEHRVNSKEVCKKRKYFILLTFYSMLLTACFFGCSLPRIVVLDDPLSPEEHLNLGVAYERNAEPDNALKEYEKASKKLPAAYLYIGNIYFQKNEFDLAESSYKKAISKDPENADAYNNLAWLYYVKKERLDDAENLAQKAIYLNPSRKDIYQDTLEKIKELKNQKKIF